MLFFRSSCRDHCLLCIVFLVAAVAFLCSCASVSSPPPDTIHLIDDADALFARGLYAEAFIRYAKASLQDSTPELRMKCVEAGARARSAADRAYEKKDFVRAGNLYQSLLTGWLQSDQRIPAFPFSENYLRQQISASAQALMETGLLKYREERLTEAIEVWKSILVFDPENKAANEAVKTASRQQEQLRVLE